MFKKMIGSSHMYFCMVKPVVVTGQNVTIMSKMCLLLSKGFAKLKNSQKMDRAHPQDSPIYQKFFLKPITNVDSILKSQ